MRLRISTTWYGSKVETSACRLQRRSANMIEPGRACLAQESIELEFLHAHRESCVLFAYRDVTITVWHGSADDVAVHVMDQVAATRIARFPGGVSGVHVVTHGAGMPTAGARSALAASARKWSAQT